MWCASPLSASEWTAAFRRKAATQRIPVSGVLELTSRCHLDCVHCYLGPRAGREQRRPAELPTERVLDIIDQIVDAGCLYLVITGGDPMMRRDFSEIYRHARRKGLLVTVFCSGTLITGAVVELFREHPPLRVDMTLYGATAETWERITRVPGSFPRFLAGVARLREAGIPYSLKGVILTANRHELAAMRRLAGELGSPGFRVDPAIFPELGSGGARPLQYRVQAEEAVRLELADPETTRKWVQFVDRCGAPATGDRRLYNCGAGVTGFYIDPTGTASPCLLTTNRRYPITGERPFAALWEHEIAGITRATAPAASPCSSCEMRVACTGCPALNLQETGREATPPSYLCELTAQRWSVIQQAKQDDPLRSAPGCDV